MSILPSLEIFSELGDAALIFYAVSHISRPVILHIINRSYYSDMRAPETYLS